MKKTLLFILRSVFILLTLVIGSLSALSQSTYVPDNNFEQALIDLGYDNVLDDYVLTANINKVETLYIWSKGIQDLTGIEDFSALTELNCDDNDLTSLDISQNTNLMNLSCEINRLTSLDVSKNINLYDLACSENNLTSLDVSNNTKLVSLHCGANNLNDLDLSHNPFLKTINCRLNSMNSLDLSHNTALTSLNCSSTSLNSLDLSNNTALTSLICSSTSLNSLDLSSNIALTSLVCRSNSLYSLDLSNNTALTSIDCSSDSLSSLDLSNNTSLTRLTCSDNHLHSLDLSYNTALSTFSCGSNNLNSLDLSKNTALTYLACQDNNLTSLDLSNNALLNRLYCYDNRLSTLDLSKNTALTDLFCQNNNLSSLDLSHNIALAKLQCSNNRLICLDVSNNPVLIQLSCGLNSLTSLNAKNGNNKNFTFFHSINCPGLNCIEVDDAEWSTANWTNKDEWAAFREDCSFPHPVIQPVPGEVTFSVIELGEQDVKMLTLKNTGDANLKIDSLKLTGEGAEAYSWVSACQDIPPFTDCNLDLYFAPSSTGTHYAELHIYSNDPENPYVKVSLEGRPSSGRLEIQNVEDDILDFGTVTIGEIATKQLVLKNTGEHNLVISSRSISGADSSLFDVSNACGFILPGESCSIEMIFHPLTTGMKTNTFTITTNDPDLPEYTITLFGTGSMCESWSFTFGYGNYVYERFFCMDTLSSGDFIVGGITGTNALLAVISPDGSIIWQKEFTGKSCIYAVRETWDNGFVIAGRSGEDYYSHHRWLARLDKDGNIIWQKETEVDYWGKIRDLQVTSDSGFIAVGETGLNRAGQTDLWIGKFDSTGTVIWQNLFPSEEGYSYGGFVVLETNEGNFIVAGSASANDYMPYHSLKKHPDGGYLYGGGPPLMFKFSPDGTLLWQKRINIHPKFWLAHISSNEEILWQYSYPNSDKFERIFDLSITSSGDIIAMGIEDEQYNTERRVMRLTKTGDIIWQKIYRDPGNDVWHTVQAHSSGSIAIAGYIKVVTNDMDGWLTLISPEGRLEGCTSNYLENSNAVATSTSYAFQEMILPGVVRSDDFIDAALVPEEGNLLLRNYCTGIPSDIDNDGIPNEEEYGPSGLDTSYDGNNDGLPDALQNNVASFRIFDGTEYVSMEAPSGTQLSEVSAKDNPSPGDQPEDISFPLGFFKFSVTGLEAGGTVAINLYFPAEFTPETYYKYAKTAGNPEPHWYEFLYDGQTGAVINPGKISLHFKDGARGDEDLTVNTIIEDIGGLGTQKLTGMEEQSDPSSHLFSVMIYPNPSRGTSNIGFKLSQSELVKIEVYDFLGRKVRTMISEELAPGNHNVEFRSESLPDGIYFLHIETGEYQDIQKIILLR